MARVHVLIYTTSVLINTQRAGVPENINNTEDLMRTETGRMLVRSQLTEDAIGRRETNSYA